MRVGRGLVAVAVVALAACGGGSTTAPTVVPTTGPGTSTTVGSTAPPATTAAPTSTAATTTSTITTTTTTTAVAGPPTTIVEATAGQQWKGVAAASRDNAPFVLVDADGASARQVTVDPEANFFLGRPTAVAGRIMSYVGADGFLTFVDTWSGAVHRVLGSRGDLTDVVVVGAPATHVLVLDSDDGSGSQPGSSWIVDTRTLEATNLDVALGLDPSEGLLKGFNVEVFGSTVVVRHIVVGSGSTRAGVLGGLTAQVFEADDPTHAVTVSGDVRDATADRLVVFRAAPDQPDAIELAVTDRAGATLWSTPAPQGGAGVIADDDHVIVAVNGSASRVTLADGSSVPVDPRRVFVSLEAVGDRQTIAARTIDGFELLDMQGKVVGRPAAYAAVSVTGILGTSLPGERCIFAGDPKAKSFILVDTANGRIVHQFAGVPTRWARSDDGCAAATVSSAGDELVLAGKVVAVPKGAHVIAISPDGAAAVIADSTAKTAFIRTAAGPSHDVPLPPGTEYAVFYT